MVQEHYNQMSDEKKKFFNKHYDNCHYGRCDKCSDMDGISNKRLWCFECEWQKKQQKHDKK